MPSAGTTSQVYIMFYGHLRTSAPVFLYGNEEDIFQSGHEDIFDISIGDIGEVYKIRIGHTNTGESPGWHCEEVQLLNIFSNEQFCIKVNRWLSRDKDDGEICTEIPVLSHGHVKLPVTKYKIEVVTGDLWNAGTEANVYISLQGQYGDTGSRKLHKSNKPTPFIKGQTDIFFLEAVHLGDLHTVIVGHDGLESGNGWYLEKVNVHDEVKDKDYTFLCYRWLDEGEEDGKLVRKLSVTNEEDFPASYELEVKKKEMWTAERWKYQNENCLQLYCKATRKYIRLTPDSRVDALGDKKDKYGFFDVLVKRGKVRVLRSHQIRHLALAIDKGIVAAMDNSGILCELQLHIQPNRCVTLESTRMPGMTISFNSDGEPANDDSRGYANIAKEFSVHVKGMFHSGAVVLLATSWSQALCLRHDGSCSGAGKQKVESYWRIHKIGPAVCMFENVTHPRMFLRIKNGICDGEGAGDEYCQFKVEKNYENGSVTLESIRSRGIYIGLLPNGYAKPMIHTGEQNIVFYPQVIKFGREKPMGTSATLSQKKEEILQQVIEETRGEVAQSPLASPPSSKRARRQSSHEIPPYSSNDWKVSVLTGSAGTSANVTLWVYGTEGSTGPITLIKDNKDHLFQPRQEDEFKVEIPSIGKLYKIRIGHDGSGDHHEWELKQITLRQMKNGKTFTFEANRWLSKSHGNLICELPVVEHGAMIYPVVKYKINVYTGHLEQAGTEAPVYICLYGERGDSGKRILFKTDLLTPFQQGQVDVFEIEAVSLGKLQRVLLGCEANRKSQYWYCEKVIIREQGELSEYIFNCERWLPYMSQGSFHSEIELLKQEMELPSKMGHPTKANEGEWKITLVTGNLPNSGTDSSVFLYVYGTEESSGPIMLGSGSHQLFNVHSADTFQINLNDLHKPYKIRIGHDNSGDNPDWYLEEIKLYHLSSDQEFYLPVNRWLGENYDDGDTWRELPLSTDANDPIELMDYEIQVYTGTISDADAESNVYIHVFGTRGDSGKRKLHKSKFQTAKFQKGQVDVFCIQAVSLGPLQKIQMSCDGSKNGKGWFLDKVIIQYTEDGNTHNALFPCSRWLDEKQEDGRTERELFVTERENPEEDIEEKPWNIHITTAHDSLKINEMKVNVIIYGSDGKTNDILLIPQNSDLQCFSSGSKDEFLVTLKDVGEIYKIRIACDHLPTAPGWHLESIHMVEQETRQKVQFDCNCWLFVDAEEEEAIKEFRVFSNQQERIPVNQYIVSVYTGDHWGAETLANVYITLYGERGDSGARELHKSSIPGDKFTRNKVDSFVLEAVSLGQLRKVVLGHDREGYGAGMYLKMVTVKESQDSLTEWVFPFWNWLDNHLGLCQTVCKLYTTGKRLSASPIPIAELGGLWIIDITGSRFESAENLNSFSLSFYGNGGKVHVDVPISGNTLQVKEDIQVGAIFKIQVSWSHTQVFKSWYLSSIHMKHTVTNQEMWFSFQCLMRPNEDKCVEIPALYPHKDPLPVVEYTISVHTGDEMVGRSTGRMYIRIEGEHGETGKRVLNVSDSDVISFTKGQVDIFTIKAVYLGQLQKILLGFNNLGTDKWFLEKIIVKEDYTSSSHTFSYNEWITSLSGDEFTESVIMLTESVVELNKITSFNTPTKGEWQLRVLGTTTLEDVDLSVVVFGKNGKSLPQQVANFNWDPFLLSVGNIGNIIKASFLSTGLSSERRLHLQKIRMRDVDTNQEIGFYPEKVRLPGEDGYEDVAEVAAVLPNQPPLDEVTYSVYIRTGDFPASSTDADVFITIYGENGDSCKRRLKPTLLPRTFDRGKINFFKIKAVDLGILSGIHIEHNAVGYGAGWYLDQITIQESHKPDIKYLFPCQRWLDTAINDKQTDCELKLLGKFNRTNEKLLTSTEGTINIIVVTDDNPNSGTNSTVSLTICCEKGNYQPVAFAKGKLSGGESKHTVELSGSFGSIQKIRLEMEDDEKDNSWFCKMVQLQHVQSGDILEFPFLQTFGSKENNFVAELPVLKPSGPLLTVKTYHISINIGQAPKPITDTDLFITLSGSMGNTGRRKVTCKRKALSSKTVGFQLETVDIGVIHELLIEKEKQSNLQLEKAVVEEGSFIKNKYIFIAQPWRKEKTKMMSMTLQMTEVKNDSGPGVLLNEIQSMASDGVWKLYLSVSSEENQISETLQHNLQWSIVFYGDKGRSNPLKLEEQNLDQCEDRLIYKVNLAHDLGELFKVRLGIENWHEDLGRLSLYHLNMHNMRTLDTFNQSINKTLPLSLSGDRWIEVPVEWPLRASLSAVTYSVTLFVTDMLEQKDKLHIGICLHGKHGDTGHRHINWQHGKNGNEDESFTAILDAVELGEVHQADISMSSSDDCKLLIKRIHVKDSSKNELYVFNVNESFSIEKEKPETRKEVVISQVVHDQQKEADDDLLLLTSNHTGTGKENIAEHLIKVYTGEVRGMGTDANVFIILFYDNGKSFGPVQLKKPLEDIKPFQNGKIDTFRITTKNIGRISHIEIGHDGKGVGNGWFLEKVEIVTESTKETALFSCNRWLAEDEDDGRTAVQLYLY